MNKKSNLILIFSLLFLLISCEKKSKEVKNITEKDLKNVFQDFFIDVPTKKVVMKDFKYQLLNGKEESFYSNKGKIIFLNFWASWCYPCKKEMPDMEELNNLLKNENFRMLVVNFGENKEIVDKFHKQYPYDFDIIIDENHAIGSQLNVDGLPATFILGKEAQILGMAMGPRHWKSEIFVNLLKQLSRKKTGVL